MANGSCMCGAVTYKITDVPENSGACHCGMCRKWTGGVFIAVQVAPGGISFTGEDNISVYTSSPWAERGFCKTCGSSLFYRITAEGAHQGEYHVGIGTLENADAVPLNSEIFIDRKPDSYAFEGDHHTMTEAEVMAMFAPD